MLVQRSAPLQIMAGTAIAPPSRAAAPAAPDRLRVAGPVSLARADWQCWKCHEMTAVHALVVAGLDEFEGGQLVDQIHESAFVYDIGALDMPAGLAVEIARQAPGYQPIESSVLKRVSWFNACACCGAPQEAFYLHSDIDGAFFGSPDDLERAQVVEVSAEGFTIPDAAYSL